MKYALEVIVFVSGAVVMIFELVGSRVLAPHLGTSIFVWTCLIGVILGSLSLGYWLGGKLADKSSDYAGLARILVVGAATLALMNLVKDHFLVFILERIADLRWSALTATITLFSLPSVILGVVSPYAVKLKMRTLETSGATVGNLYAISTLGSIIGTFLAGFFLIPSFGSSRIISMLAVVMVLTSFLAVADRYRKTRLLFVILWTAYTVASPTYFARQGALDIDTKYSRVLISDTTEPDSGRPVRFMQVDKSNSSAMYLDGDDLVFDYLKFCNLAEHFKPDLKNVLMLGGAAYVYPRSFLKTFPDATVDVVEIDPQLTELAKKYFRLGDSPQLTTHHEDGRLFLNRNTRKYDVVFIDAFNTMFSLPYHLTTREMIHRISDSLVADGAVLVNILSPLDGRYNDFLRAEYSTYRSVFPQVYLFPVQGKEHREMIQNVLLVALKSDRRPSFQSSNPAYNNYLSHLLNQDLFEKNMILTDEHAPVDYYMNKTLALLSR